MFKRISIIILIIAAVILIVFQVYTLFYMMFYMQTSAVPGEEDVVIRNGNQSEKMLTITCNVDWGEDIIPGMLEVFKEKDIKVTFCVSGKWAKNNPYLLRKIHLYGHEIQSHGYSHKLCSKISAEETRNEIQKTEDVIFELIGVKTTVFAPPSGDYNKDTVNICREMGYTLSLWSADSIDWREDSKANVIIKRVLNKPLMGAIILIHPKEETLKALPSLIEEIKNQDIEIVPLYQLLQKL